MRIPAVVALVAILLAMPNGTSPCSAEEFATGPYRQLFRPLGMTVGGDAVNIPVKVKFLVSTTHPGMKPEDIRLTLKTAEESIQIPVAKDGSIDLPVSQKWFDADAIIESNVPKGQLHFRGQAMVEGEIELPEMSVGIMPHVDEGQISYATLVRLARDHRQLALKAAAEAKIGMPIKQADIVPEPLDADWVLVLWAPEDPDSAKAVIVEKVLKPEPTVLGRIKKALVGKKSKLRKVKGGMFAITCSEALADENPMLSLSPNPSWSCAILTPDEMKKVK